MKVVCFGLPRRFSPLLVLSFIFFFKYFPSFFSVIIINYDDDYYTGDI